MIKINDKIIKQLDEEKQKYGMYCDQGAVIGDSEWIVVIKGDTKYLAHRCEFIFDGALVKLKSETINPQSDMLEDDNPYGHDKII